MSNGLSTAGRELVGAVEKQQAAHDAEWENLDDPTAQRKREFWDSEVNQLRAQDPDDIVVLF